MTVKEILPKLANMRIVVVGDLILDKYIWGDVNRISPEAPIPVLEVTSETNRVGGAANVAHNVASLGGDAILIGLVGDDSDGELLRKIASKHKINTAGITINRHRPTSTKTRVIAQHQQVVRFDRESLEPAAPHLHGELCAIALKQASEADAIIFADYDKGVVTAELIEKITDIGRQKNIPIVVDPKAKNFWHYRNVTSITPNQKEAGIAVGRKLSNHREVVEAGLEILQRLELKHLLITQGENGMTLFDRKLNSEPIIEQMPTQPREVFDVTGAGDTVVALFALALAAKIDPLTSAKLANIAGGIVVGEVGCVPITPEQLIDHSLTKTTSENRR